MAGRNLPPNSEEGLNVSRAAIDVALERFLKAIERNRSLRRCLRLWSEFIRVRDGRRCVVCHDTSGLSAHHLIRKGLIPEMQLEFGNGITLCRSCHREPHEAFNRRPDLTLPMDYEGGDNIDLAAALFNSLGEDAKERGLLCDEYYYVSDSALRTFKRLQCIDPDLEFPGYRVEQAYLIWRQTSRAVLHLLLEANGVMLPPDLIQTGPLTIISADVAG
jgi:hypothetical protein